MLKSPVPIADQAMALQRMFPDSQITFSVDRLEWVGTLQPSPYSSVYTIKVEYKLSEAPKTLVLNPELSRRLEEPDTPIPHMFGQKYLCLYYPRAGEWRRIDWLHKSILPWASCWLYYYELWHATGEWLGGGIKHGDLGFAEMDDVSNLPNYRRGI